MIVMRGVDDTSNKQLEQIRPAARSCLLNCGVERRPRTRRISENPVEG